MLQDWLANKMTRIRKRFDHQQLVQESEQSVSSTSSECSKTPKPSQSVTIPRERRQLPMTGTYRKMCTQMIEERMAIAGEQCYLEPGDSETEACGRCHTRVAKFIGEKCKHAHICRHCGYELLLIGLQSYEGGIMSVKCTLCWRHVTGLVRTGRRSIWAAKAEEEARLAEKQRRKENGEADEDEENDENDPNFSNGEVTISFQDCAEDCVRVVTGGPRVNQGFESSSSF